MTSFGRLNKSFSARKGKSWILTLTPFLRSSSERKSASKTPNRTTVFAVTRFSELAGIKRSQFRGGRKFTIETIKDGNKLYLVLKVWIGPYSRVTTSRIALQLRLLIPSHSLHERITPKTLTAARISGHISRRVQNRAARGTAPKLKSAKICGALPLRAQKNLTLRRRFL
jgi:hypothetical protein